MVSVQAKIVGDFCNLRCTYCRDRDYSQGRKEVMHINMLETLIDSLANTGRQKQRIHWLGGEPTLAGIGFFENAMRFQKKYPAIQWRNSIQTNATRINEEWASFFRENNFSVGVSIDGTEQTHNTDRILSSGKGTYSKALQGVKVLNAFGIAPSVICVVTKQNASRGAEILQGLVNAGFTKIAFNAFYNTATDRRSDVYAVNDTLWTAFLKDIFEEWLLLNRPDVQVRELDEMIAWTQGKRANACTFNGSCSSWVLVDHDGKMYPCERLGRDISLGDVSSDSIKDIALNTRYQAFRCSTLVVPDTCKVCTMHQFCHNGCIAHRSGDESHYAYCSSRLNFYDYITKRIDGVPVSQVMTSASVPAVPLVNW